MKLNEVVKTESLSTMKEVADFMGISYYTLYRIVKSGKIKAINIAKTGSRPIFGFTPEAVQNYYDQLSDTIKGTESINK